MKETPLTVSASKEDAEKVRSIILDHALFDPERSVKRDERVHFPIGLPEDKDLVWLRSLVGNVEISDDLTRTGTRAPHLSPFERIAARLEEELSGPELEVLPDRWEKIGKCLVLKLPVEFKGKKNRIAEVYMDVLGGSYVLEDEGGISGELREPLFRTIIPPADGNYNVVHKEGGSTYWLDPRRIMFSSGNVLERVLFPRIIRKGPMVPSSTGDRNPGDDEVILDMFAGIGYFSIPVARSCSPERIISIEKNPVSFNYLERNIEDNEVAEKVECILGDNRDVSPKGSVDRVIMGYVGGTVGFLPTALEALRPEGGILHVHDTVKIEDGRDGLLERARNTAEGSGWSLDLIGSRRVKSFAPRIDHIAVDIMVLPIVP
ncbi:MAG: hypothetical protein U9R75_07710 [Candidatus Thermoplasmatota archaeon]|nr:hypothetical protein [Candidatus Thermoplasmatota archaeon]